MNWNMIGSIALAVIALSVFFGFVFAAVIGISIVRDRRRAAERFEESIREMAPAFRIANKAVEKRNKFRDDLRRQSKESEV